VLFAGDAAHGVSPFGARGANSGVQDADNLGWKLAAVLNRQAPDRLLDTYATEREFAADENIRHSTRSTDFITPKSPVSRLFRDAVLELARTQPFARNLVNSGRLSTPATLVDSTLNTADVDEFAGAMVPGAPAVDAPVSLPDGRAANLLSRLGAGFTLLFAGAPSAALRDVDASGSAFTLLAIGTDIGDPDGLLARRYDLHPGSAILFRPDQHVCARWRQVDAGRVGAAIRHALALDPRTPWN